MTSGAMRRLASVGYPSTPSKQFSSLSSPCWQTLTTSKSSIKIFSLIWTHKSIFTASAFKFLRRKKMKIMYVFWKKNWIHVDERPFMNCYFYRSPANVDAAKEWRENYPEFKKKVARCVRKSQEELWCNMLTVAKCPKSPKWDVIWFHHHDKEYKRNVKKFNTSFITLTLKPLIFYSLQGEILHL